MILIPVRKLGEKVAAGWGYDESSFDTENLEDKQAGENTAVRCVKLTMRQHCRTILSVVVEATTPVVAGLWGGPGAHYQWVKRHLMWRYQLSY